MVVHRSGCQLLSLIKDNLCCRWEVPPRSLTGCPPAFSQWMLGAALVWCSRTAHIICFWSSLRLSVQGSCCFTDYVIYHPAVFLSRDMYISKPGQLKPKWSAWINTTRGKRGNPFCVFGWSFKNSARTLTVSVINDQFSVPITVSVLDLSPYLHVSFSSCSSQLCSHI